MENVFPPSYEEANTKNYWTIIAPYVASPDLYSTSLVCRRWYDVFIPCLWGNPTCHFTTDNDRIYIALTNFRRTLPYARHQVRCLTHTLHLPPALWDIYDRPKPEWLLEVLNRLPNLQSLVVSGLPFFDHPSLLSLTTSITGQSPTDIPHYALRLLIAAKCENTTSSSLANALLHLPNLAFIDLSQTRSARDKHVLTSLGFMYGLKVLKLRGIGLRDEEMEVVTSSIGLKLRSLDVRDNRLTDNSISSLLSNCVHPIKNAYLQYHQETQTLIDERGWSSEVSRPNIRVLENFRGEDIDKRFVKTLTESVVGKLASEDLPHMGLTHLYIANNNVSIEGIGSLLRTQNFHALDIGTVQIAKSLSQPESLDLWARFSIDALPTRLLAPVLEAHAGDNLTYLRAHHAVVTVPSPLEDVLQSVTVLGTVQSTVPALQTHISTQNGERGLHRYVSSSGRDTDLPSYEMIGYELKSNAQNSNGATLSTHPELPPRSELAENEYSPVPKQPGHVNDNKIPIKGFGLATEHARPGLLESLNPDHSGPQKQSLLSAANNSSPIQTQNPPSISEIEILRNSLRHRNGSRGSTGLIPGLLPSLQTLVLTDVPNTDTANGMVFSALKRFITTCALESHLATNQSIIEHPKLYISSVPRYLHKQHRAAKLFGLRRIVLEMASQKTYADTLAATLEGGSHGKTQKVESRWNKSSTEDADAEVLWDASGSDFTFFDDERGMRTREVQQENHLGEGPGKDVVVELAKWRAQRRQIKESSGQKDSFVEGYWEGEIKIVRPESGKVGASGWYEQFLESSFFIA